MALLRGEGTHTGEGWPLAQHGTAPVSSSAPPVRVAAESRVFGCPPSFPALTLFLYLENQHEEEATVVIKTKI